MMRLAAAGAVAIRPERSPYHQYWTTFDPATVAMKRVENAVIDDRPDFALRLARDIRSPRRPHTNRRQTEGCEVKPVALGWIDYDRSRAPGWEAAQMRRLARRLGYRLVWPKSLLPLADHVCDAGADANAQPTPRQPERSVRRSRPQ